MTLPNGFWWIRTIYWGAHLILLCTGHFTPLILCWNFHTKFHEYFRNEKCWRNDGTWLLCYIIVMCTLCKEYVCCWKQCTRSSYLCCHSVMGNSKLLASETTCRGLCPYSSVQDSLNYWILRSFMHQELTVVMRCSYWTLRNFVHHGIILL